MSNRPRVAVIVEASLVYGREVLRGIADYMQTHQPWSIFLSPRDYESPAPSWLRSWQGDGVICRATDARLARALARSQVPIVDLNENRDLGLPRIRSDHVAIGRLGARHLIERGFRHFGFCGFRGQEWSARRRDGFSAAVREAGFTCSVCESDWVRRHSRPWEQERQKLVAWLGTLVKPVGVMACWDLRGQEVLDACRWAAIAVPEVVAVVGVDNDELLCSLCDPPLTSILPNARRIGYEAASLLAELMDGRTRSPDERVIEPLAVATRQSTDILAINDPDIAVAVKYIRETACSGVTVEEVVRHAAISRSRLERGFHKFLGRTPKAEIRQVQLKRVKRLLDETDLPLAQIARLAGYEHPEYLNVVFKREIGQSPGRYRRQGRPKR